MENNNLSSLQLRSSIISETNQGLEMARQLKNNLKTLSSFLSPAKDFLSPTKDCNFLVNMIIESQNRVLSMLESSNALQSMKRDSITTPTITTVAAVAILESPPPPSPNRSPLSDDSDMEDDDKNICHSSSARNTTPIWSKLVRIYPRSVSKAPLADGHNWRKYGQKRITGAKYPRSYYRCTQRIAQGCCARRQVQRTNEDPSIVQVTYIREHTCKPIRSSKPAPAPKKQQQLNVSSIQNNINIIDMHHQDQHALMEDTKHQYFPSDLSFHYPPPPSSNNNALPENYPFASPNYPVDENAYYPRVLSPCREYYTENYFNVHQSSDQEIVEKASSSTNTVDMNSDYFSMFGPTSTYGNSGFFS